MSDYLGDDLGGDFFWETQSRAVLLKEIGVGGVKKIREAAVLVVGLGGLGVPVTTYLASSGVGKLGLVDGDQIEPSNLGRQFLYGVHDVGKTKAKVLSERVKAMHPKMEVETFSTYFDEEALLAVMEHYDIVIDAVDNLKSKWMIHDVCVEKGKPFIHGGVLGWQGQVLTVLPVLPRRSFSQKRETTCLRCFFPSPDLEEDLTCSEAGVLSSLCGVIGSLQATEVLKYLAELPPNYFKKMLRVDLQRGQFRLVAPVVEKCHHTSYQS